MKKTICVGLVLTGVCAAEVKTDFGGYFWSRYESRGSETPGVDSGLTYTRFSPASNIVLNSKTRIYFNPQFSRIWGEREDGASASGSLKDPGLNVHQAFASRDLTSRWKIVVGRKELNFGDQLLVGGVSWHYVGRSFDLVELNGRIGDRVNVTAFHSNLVENDNDAGVDKSTNFSGAYFAYSGNMVEELDFYWFDKNEPQTDGLGSVETYGARLAQKSGPMSLTVEGAVQDGREVDGEKVNGENLVYAKASYLINALEVKPFLGYSRATKDFDQLFPTAHKWLGLADRFSRRNISSYVFGASWKAASSLSVTLAHHMFQRVDKNAPAYRFNGQAYGAEGDAEEIAVETDLTFVYKFDEGASLLGGYSLVEPLGYLEDQGIEDSESWGFISLAFKF